MIIKHALVGLTTHATAYSFTIPGNASNLRFHNREGTEVIRYSFDNFTTYFTLPIPAAGAAANNTGVQQFINYKASPAGQVIYFMDPSNDGKNVEIEYTLDG